MESDYYKEFKKAEEFYFSLQGIKCSFLDGRIIYFKRKGFSHFLRNKKGLRPIKEQFRRFNLLYRVPEILASNNVYVHCVRGRKFYFYSIKKYIRKDYFIKIVAIETKKNQLHFFSIMDKNLPDSTQTP